MGEGNGKLMSQEAEQIDEVALFEDVSAIIERGRREIALYASRGTVYIFWEVGKRINQDVLGKKRAEYGKQIVSRLATQLVEKMNQSGLFSVPAGIANKLSF